MIELFQSPEFLTVVGFALWAASEILAEIPSIESNSIFQVIKNFLARFKR